MTRPIAVSAPGKVLFTGGFLVLDRKYTGLVLGLDARIHVRIEEWKEPRSEIDEAPTTKVLVQSPQFRDAKWLYSISAASDLVLVKQITE